MRQSMLTDEQARFLREEKETLAEIRLALAEIDVPREVADHPAGCHPATG